MNQHEGMTAHEQWIRKTDRFRDGGARFAEAELVELGDKVIAETVERRKWLYGLTAGEWLHLAAEGQDSEVAPCCGNIGGLREYLNALATCQGQGEAGIMLRAVLESYEAAASDHEAIADAGTFPLLHRVLAGIRAQQAADEEFARRYREAQLKRAYVALVGDSDGDGWDSPRGEAELT